MLIELGGVNCNGLALDSIISLPPASTFPRWSHPLGPDVLRRLINTMAARWLGSRPRERVRGSGTPMGS